MPLTRVAVVGGPDAGGREDHVRAAADLRRVLAERGIAVAAPGDRADGFIALPGGTVTLADFFSICLESANGESSDKPCGLLNTGNYFSDLLKGTDDRVVEVFVRESQRGRLVVERDPAVLVRSLVEYAPPETRRTSRELA